MGLRVARWMLFGVVLGLVPLFVSFAFARTMGIKEPWLQIITSRGELLLVCAGIAGAAIGELAGKTGRRFRMLKIVAICGCIAVVTFGSAWYGFLVHVVQQGQAANLSFVTDGSLCLFSVTLAAAGGCVALSEV